MFQLFRKKDKRRDPMPSWMKWAVGAFIIYAIVTNSSDRHQDAKMPNGLSGSRQIAEDYKNKLLGRGRNGSSIKDTLAGSGAPVFCGQNVTIRYQPLDDQGKAMGEIQNTKFRFGAGKADPALERALPGMRVSGKRMVNTNGENSALPPIFELELVEVNPTLPDLTQLMFRGFDTAPGSGATVACGQMMKADITVWNLEGKKIFSTIGKSPLSFTPGKDAIPMGLEIGISGMRKGGSRTLIIPPALAKPMHGEKPTVNLPLPAAQTTLVDVEIKK
jgi:FKBP-type peptidyl-prolyl cis-trans isomerase 2